MKLELEITEGGVPTGSVLLLSDVAPRGPMPFDGWTGLFAVLHSLREAEDVPAQHR